MQVRFISAEKTQLIDAHVGCGEIKFREFDSGKYDIMLAGAAKKAPVKVLEVRTAQAQCICELADHSAEGELCICVRILAKSR